MRYDLTVPFAEKDAAKQLGARWDAANKLWYVQDKTDMTPFAKWNPTPRDASSTAATSAPARAPAKAKMNASVGGNVQVGSKYAPQPRVCDCAPWEVCDKCRATALSF